MSTRTFSESIGVLRFNEEHKFFYGKINGYNATMNKATDKEGNTIFIINIDHHLYEKQAKTTGRNTFKSEDVAF